MQASQQMQSIFICLCRARELLNDFLACEAGPSLPVADLRELQTAAGLVQSIRAMFAGYSMWLMLVFRWW
jgi:hypothetical protein